MKISFLSYIIENTILGDNYECHGLTGSDYITFTMEVKTV